MKKTLFTLLFFTAYFILPAQNKITVESIYDGTFSQDYINEIRPLNDGEHYTVLEYGNQGTQINKYSYESFTKTETLVDGTKLLDAPFFTGYEFSPDESMVLLVTEATPIYRHSYTANHFLYNLKTGELSELSQNVEQEPLFSPDGSKIAYVFENNIYIKDLRTNNIVQVTRDGEFNSIINGISDWVYEEEFGFVRAFDWSKDSKYLSFIKFDESRVPEISMDIFGETLYPEALKFKYPKAGEKNSSVSVNIFSLETASVAKVKFDEAEDFYVPRMKWNNKDHSLVITKMNRHQNVLQLIEVDAATMSQFVLLEESSDTYIDVDDALTFLDDNSFIFTSEKSGYNHAYHYNSKGKLIRQITRGDWELTDFYGYDPDSERIFYQSTENGSVNRAVYSVKLNGKSKRDLSVKDGVNSAKFSKNYRYFINTNSTANSPYVFTLNSAKNGDLIKVIEDNKVLAQKLDTYTLSGVKFLNIKNSKGDELNAWMIKPRDFDPTKKYPLLMYVYGGPGSQTVMNRWGGANTLWFEMLAEQGYIVVSVDGRGTGGKGAFFKKQTYKELGKLEIEDQIDAARYLGGLPYVDAGRIGMFGWSFGGYMTSLAMTKGADVFKAGIAVAPVTNWRFYDSIYTERYMQTPEENANGYDENSPINHVDKLKGNYLLIHGSADDNVHYQNTMRMVEALVQADKQFELFIYPDKNHGIYGGNTRIHLYKKMTKFIKENL